jgi:hypothetical protein
LTTALLLAEDKSTRVINGALVGVLLSQSASPSVVCLSSPRTINLGLITEGKLAAILITPFCWGSQRAGYFPCLIHASKGKKPLKDNKRVAGPPKVPKVKPKVKCFYCKGDGHWKRNCPKYLEDKKAGKVVARHKGIFYIYI